MSKSNLSEADRAVRFINNLTCTGNYLDKPFRLRPWQESFVRQLFKTRADGQRQYKKAFLMLPRKQGKTELMAALLVYFLIASGKKGLYIISAAADREQAAEVFNAASTMIRNDPKLDSFCEITLKKIVCKRNKNTFVATSAEAKTKHGKKPSILLFDELHCYTSRELHASLTSGLGSAIDPLTLIISTAGIDKTSLCKDEFEYAKKVQSGERVDPEYLSVLYYAEEDEDIYDEKVWHRVMPALGDYCNLDWMRSEFANAKLYPQEEVKCRYYYLNQFLVGKDTNKWLAPGKWDTCQKEFDPNSFRGHSIWCGLDFSSTNDFTSLVCVAERDGLWYCWPYFWIPLNVAKTREQRDVMLWKGWRQRGLVNIVEGDCLNHNDICAEIPELLDGYNVEVIAADQAYASSSCLSLRDSYGFNLEYFSQSLMNMTGPVRALEAAINLGQICHNNHPTLNWQMGNACTTKADPNGNYKLNKGTSADKIDGVVSLVMAYNKATTSFVPEVNCKLFFV